MAVQQMRMALSGNYAVSYAVKQADVDVVAAYPITPQVAIVEKISEYVSNGELVAEFVPVESEHSAISVVTAAVASGARAFTATSSQGLLLMHEILFITASLRLPVVMAVANRAVSAPINIWNDHSDSMAQRDTGWIQFYVESSQEVYDTVLQAFRIGEDRRVRLPVMVNLDGYVLSHTYEPVDVLPDEVVRDFLPRVDPPFKLDPDNPVAIGTLGPPEYYYEIKYQEVKAVEDSKEVIKEVGRRYGEISGRSYDVIDTFAVKDADVVLISMGAVTSTARYVAKQLRARGVKAGLVKLRVFRPFPATELLSAIQDAKAVGVIDRATSPGAVGGPVFMEVGSMLYINGIWKPVVNFIAGIGGRDVKPDDISKMYEVLMRTAEEGRVRRPVEYIGLRGWEV